VRPGDVVVIALCVGIAIVACCLAWHDGAGFVDARTIWMLKARVLALDGSLGGPFFTEWHDWTERRGYPLLVPIHYALHHVVAGRLDDDALKLGHAFVGVLVLALIALRLLPRVGAHVTAVAVLCFAVTSSWLSMTMWANADVFVAMIALLAIELADRAVRDSTVRGFALLGLLLGALVATKSEGVILALTIGGVTVVRCCARLGVLRASTWMRVGVMLLPALVHVVAWRAFVASHGFVDSLWKQSALDASLSTVDAVRGRLDIVLRHLGVELLRPRWAFAWPAFAVLCFFRGRVLLRATETYVALAMLAAVIVVFGFVARDPTWLLNTAAARVLFQVQPALYVVVFTAAFAPRLRGISEGASR
jgi:hypothetical protein